MKRTSIAMLAVVAGLYGCATTESTDSTTPGATSSSTGTQSGGVTPGTAKPPVGVSKGSTGTFPGTAPGQRPDLKYSVYYEFDKYDVKPEYRTLVESHARWLKANPTARLTIEGNADEQGSREYNLALGQRRAESVTKMLTLMGAKPEQIEAISYGEERPRSAGHDEKAWAENRRSDFANR
jgi:peptidoglycan-associated lipoprotein